MNKEQIKSLLRTLGATFGGLIAGYFAAKGWIDADTVTGILTSETFISLAASVIVGIWGLVDHTKANAVAVVKDHAKEDPATKEAVVAMVDAMPEVAKVITKATPAGEALAMAVPSPTVVAASDPRAKL